METIKVLLFAANAPGTAPLDLAREFREIDEEVRMSPFRSAVELILVPAARPIDLLRKLNENRPQVVHFSSHGDPEAIHLESDDPQAETPGPSGSHARGEDERDMKAVPPDVVGAGGIGPGPPPGLSKSTLARVLRACDEGELRLVVLNACHTRSQAEALTEVVDCVVSMNRTISDRAAIKFAASFYGALAFGKSVQKAFEQGVARLSAEGIGEADTPELLVRAGVDPSRVVLVGPGPRPGITPAAAAPFLVPFPWNADFVGRDGDLARLHASLSGSDAGPVGIRPAGLTGMGGIGKTQLAVEYVHRHRGDYPDGIYWVDAAGSLAEGFAQLATDPRLRWAEAERPRDERVWAAFAALDGRPRALLVLDNLPDPAAIAVPLLPGCTPEDLRCRLLFTTRRHDLGRFAGIEVTVLPEEPALRLLLRHPSRRAALDPAHPDHEHARAVARMLGRLPLALELAGAYLGKYSGDVPLEGYREGLKSDGALVTLDADAAEVSEADLRRVHAPAVAATIREQWEGLGDESARWLLRVASLFAESAAVPTARLGLLADLADKAPPGRISPLRRAVKRLEDACLVERLEGERLRLHPLIREFAGAETPTDPVDGFRRRCLERAVAALEHFPTLEALDERRGVDGLQEDLIALLDLCPPSAPDLGARLQAVLRLLRRESHYLRTGDAESRPTLFAQQIRNRAALLGIDALRSGAERRLTTLGRPHLRLLWTASRESPGLVRTLAGHRDWVVAVTMTPDGRAAVSASGDGTLKLWDLATGQALTTFTGHEAAVNAVAAPDDRRALSASDDRTLRLWDRSTGQLLRTLTGHARAVRAVTVTPDGRHALSGSDDHTLKLWDLATGQVLRSMAGHVSTVKAVAVTPDGRYGLSASAYGTVRIRDLASGEAVRTLDGHHDRLTALAISPDCRHVLSASDSTLRVRDLSSGQVLRRLTGHVSAVSAVTVAADGRHALSGESYGTINLWDLATGQVLQTFAGHDDRVSAVVVAPDGHHALSASHDRTLKLWDLAAGPLASDSSGHAAAVSAVAITADGRHVVSASHDCTLRLWDLATGRTLRTFTGHDDKVSAVAITADGRLALAGSYDRTLRLWDLATGQLLRTFTGHSYGVNSAAVTPDGRHAVSASHDRTLRLWDLATGRPLRTFTGHKKDASAVAITPDGRHALSASHEGTLKLWDLSTGQLRGTFIGHEAPVGAAAISPDGRHALSASHDRTLRLWDLATGQVLRIFTGHERTVTAVAVTPDGRLAVSGSTDRTLRFWDVGQGVCRALALLESSPLAIAVAPDGRTIVVGDRVGNLHHFQIHGM
jgi:WD40 repeat protein